MSSSPNESSVQPAHVRDDEPQIKQDEQETPSPQMVEDESGVPVHTEIIREDTITTAPQKISSNSNNSSSSQVQPQPQPSPQQSQAEQQQPSPQPPLQPELEGKQQLSVNRKEIPQIPQIEQVSVSPPKQEHAITALEDKKVFYIRTKPLSQLEPAQKSKHQTYVYLQEQDCKMQLSRFYGGSRCQHWLLLFNENKLQEEDCFMIRNVESGNYLAARYMRDNGPTKALLCLYEETQLGEEGKKKEEGASKSLVTWWWKFDGKALYCVQPGAAAATIVDNMEIFMLDVKIYADDPMSSSVVSVASKPLSPTLGAALEADVFLCPYLPEQSSTSSYPWEIVGQEHVSNSMVIVEEYFYKDSVEPVLAVKNPEEMQLRIQEGSLEVKEDSLFSSKWKKCYFALTKGGILTQFDIGKDKKTLMSIDIRATKLSFSDDFSKALGIKLMYTVARKSKTLVISPYNSLEYRNWKRAFKAVGAQEIEVESETVHKKGGFLNAFSSPLLLGKTSTRSLSRVETIDVMDWTETDVQEWLSYIHTQDGNLLARCGESFLHNDIDGKVLLQLTDNGLRDAGVTSLGVRKRLLKEIEKLKNQRHYDLNEHFVFSKVKNMDPKYLKHIPDMEDMVRSLCNKQEIRSTYLSTERFNSEQLRKWIESSRDPDDFDIVEDKEMRQYEELKVRVKLVVTEIVHSDKEKQIRKILSPVIARIPTMNQEFGLFHTSIVVGPWYLEWTDSSLCIPKKVCSSMALLSADVDNIIVQKDKLSEIADKIADVVVEWNVNNVYVNIKTAGKKENEGNCQDFVDSVLDKLGVKSVFTGALGTFITQMRTKGHCSLEFVPDKDFRDKFDLQQKTFTFDSHAELDTFVTQLKQKCHMFKLDYPSEWGLLKSFDRAFWLRHFKDTKHPKYIPLGGPSPPPINERTPICATKCPFGNPIQTHSYF